MRHESSCFPDSRNMHVGTKTTFKSSRPRRAAAVKARTSTLPSNNRSPGPPTAPTADGPENPPKGDAPKPMHPLKKRLTRSWNEPTPSNRRPPRVQQPAANTNLSPSKDGNTALPSEKPSQSPNESRPKDSCAPPPQKIARVSPLTQPLRRRYPKLLVVDDDGRIIPNPLKLPSATPPAPFIVPGDVPCFEKGQLASSALLRNPNSSSSDPKRIAAARVLPVPTVQEVPQPPRAKAKRLAPRMEQHRSSGQRLSAHPNDFSHDAWHFPSQARVLPVPTVQEAPQPPRAKAKRLAPRMEQHRSSGQRLSAHPNDFSHDAWHLPSQVNKTFTGPIILPTGHLPTDAGRPRHESGAAGASKRIAPRPNPVQSASIPVAAPPIQRDASATHARHSAQPVRLAPNGTGSSSPKGAVRRNSSGANPAHTGRKLPAAVKSQTDAQLPVRCRSQSPKELQYARRLPPQAAKARPSPIEQVIQVGNRCGNQDYWRSSLQMPKRTGVKKATGKVRSRLTESQNSRATEKTQQPSRDIHAQGDGGGATRKGMPPKEKESEVGGRRYESGLVDPSLTRTPLDVGQHHEFWRKSTKLPSVSSNKARQRRLADGKRRALDVMEGRGPLAEKSDILGQATGRARKSNVVPSDQVTISSPGKNRRVNEAVESFGKEDSANGDTPLALDNRSGERQRTPQEFLDEELKDNRKIIRTKDYEVRQMEAYAESRLHVKMNLRGRNKIWNWLSGGDRLTSYSVMFLVFTMDLDRKLISSSSTERKQALEEMENDSLRMLEALMMRLGTKDGCDNWHALTENFNLEE